jgi:hypothetical protein
MGRRRAEAQQQTAYQDQRIDDLESRQPAPAPAAASSGGMSDQAIERLQQLAKLHEQGILTDDEFAQQKEQVLAG